MTRWKDKPFFLYLTYNALHFPLEAPDETIAKYEAKFEDAWVTEFGDGWDDMREKKLLVRRPGYRSSGSEVAASSLFQ